jgi:hypothetical protein
MTSMKKKNLLALAIPTSNRPDLAIRAIKNAISIGIYDQIIVSSNSYEEKIDSFIKNIRSKKVTYFQQQDNVGMSMNFFRVIKLCQCKYLHIVRDKDLLNKQNTIDLYSTLDACDDFPIAILSIKDINGKLYRDASWQKNTNLRNVFGETGHMGSSIINVNLWDKEVFAKMYSYCNRRGDVYPTAAAAILSYSVMQKNLLYFAPHIVEMHQETTYSEMSGHSIYGFAARLNQFISLFILMTSLDFKNIFFVYMHLFNMFFHFHFIDAISKYPDDRPISITKDIMKNKEITFKIKFAVYFSLSMFYYFRGFYFLRRMVGNILRMTKLR